MRKITVGSREKEYEKYTDYISVESDDMGKFNLKWKAPILKAWLVMVDDSYLRVDYKLNDGSLFTGCGKLAYVIIPKNSLQVKNWDAKEVKEISDNEIHYKLIGEK